MNVENLQSKTNELLGRREVEAFIVFGNATPTRDEIKKALCAKVGANPELCILREVRSEYGMKRVKAVLHVYEDAEKMKVVEPPHLLKRDKLIKEEPKAEEKKEGQPPAKKE